jgi:hypothetical protein
VPRALLAIVLLCAATAALAQREFREFRGERPLPLPTDYKEPAEFVFGRLIYPSGGGGGFGGRRGGGGGNWTNDYPAADRHLMVALRRLTVINARSVEQPVDIGDEDPDDIFNWPFLFAGRTTNISLDEDMVNRLREYLDRGGFLICDDMWGPGEHAAVLDLAKQLYPEREPVELGDNDLVMHTVFNLNDRYQIIGAWGARSGFTEPFDGVSYDAHWRSVTDSKDHMVMGIWLNSDTADSWEWADDPDYPEKLSALGFRIIINHIAYAMTH